MTTLKIFKTHENVELPKFQTKQSACFDLAYNNAGKQVYKGFTQNNKAFERVFTDATILIGPHERVLVPTGLIFDIPVGYSVRIHPRSGLSFKNGLQLANCEAVIDSDYVEETFLLIHNTTEVAALFTNGDRLAQAELVKSEVYSIEGTTTQPTQKTDRAGGLGSTGVQGRDPRTGPRKRVLVPKGSLNKDTEELVEEVPEDAGSP